MSSDAVEELRVELAALRVRVRLQEEKVERLEEKLRQETSLRQSRGGSEDLRSERSEQASFSVSAIAPSEAGGPSSAGYSLITEGGGPVPHIPGVGSAVSTEDHQGRIKLARACGQFLKRAVEEDYRGPSGRDRLRLQSRLYIVVKDYSGQRFDPVKVCYNFAEVRGLCKRGSCCGQAVFIGFATRWEAETAVEAGGFNWPQGQ